MKTHSVDTKAVGVKLRTGGGSPSLSFAVILSSISTNFTGFTFEFGFVEGKYAFNGSLNIFKVIYFINLLMRVLEHWYYLKRKFNQSKLMNFKCLVYETKKSIVFYSGLVMRRHCSQSYFQPKDQFDYKAAQLVLKSHYESQRSSVAGKSVANCIIAWRLDLLSDHLRLLSAQQIIVCQLTITEVNFLASYGVTLGVVYAKLNMCTATATSEVSSVGPWPSKLQGRTADADLINHPSEAKLV